MSKINKGDKTEKNEEKMLDNLKEMQNSLKNKL